MAPLPATDGFQAVHDRHRADVLRYLTRVVGPAEAEDLTQEVMLKVSRALPRFRGDASLSTWVYRIASNVAMDSFRRKATRPATDPEVEPEDAAAAAGLHAASLEDTAIRQEMSACVREFVDGLPDKDRMILVLSDLEGFSNEEIAAILGVTLGAAKIRLHRARDRLRGVLQSGCSFGHDPEGGFACDRKPATVRAARGPARHT